MTLILITLGEETSLPRNKIKMRKLLSIKQFLKIKRFISILQMNKNKMESLYRHIYQMNKCHSTQELNNFKTDNKQQTFQEDTQVLDFNDNQK